VYCKEKSLHRHKPGEKTPMKKIIIASIIVIAVFYSVMSGVIEAKDSLGFEQSTFNNIEITIQEMRAGDWRLSSNSSTQLQMGNKNRNRSFSFYKESMLMVFVGSNDYDRMSKSTGSHTYRLLPFREIVMPSFARVDDNTIEGMSPSGYKVTFSAESGDVSAIEGFTVSTTPLEHFDEIVKKKGGVEIKPQKGFLLIDYGWMTGSSAHSRIWTSPVIYDGMGNKCQIKNSDIAMQDPKDPDEVILKYKTNGDMVQFLKKRCPSLRLQ
jgi:hypothetical protein